VWEARSLLAAELDDGGAILQANGALEQFAGRPLARSPFAELVAAPQRAAFARWLADAGPEWASATFALLGDPTHPAVDRTVWCRREEGRLLIIAEPALEEQERLVQTVLELNDDLVGAHRELVRQRDHIRRLESITAAGLTHLRLHDVLDDLLHAILGAITADRAVILLRNPVHGDLVVEAALGINAEVQRQVRVPIGRGVAGGIAAAGRPRLIHELRTEPEVVSAYLRRSARSMAGVPLTLDGEAIGVLHISADTPGRFTEEDLQLLVAAAERAVLAIGRAQLHERERSIGETLQRALLPEQLPVCIGATLTARFFPAAGTQVGGDWYDALPLPGGQLALAIGDVAGKGVRAAALMGELRGGLRTAALDGGEPEEMLARLDRVAARSRHMATVGLVLLDTASWRLRHVSAGHLPPLLVRADGSAEYLRDGRSTPLMAFDASVRAGVTTLAPGDRLVLYTDGLVERRREPIDTSLETLRRAAEGGAATLDALVDRLVAAVPSMPDTARDDTAVIAVERTADAPGQAAGETSPRS
jgi:putative methionine-R-sulfoxide reductase with GAF domain